MWLKIGRKQKLNNEKIFFDLYILVKFKLSMDYGLSGLSGCLF